MTKKNNETKFAVCISSDDPDLLTPRRIYQVLQDKSAARSNDIRVIDNEGEDYLYPADYFLFIELPAKLSKPYLKLLSRPTSVMLRIQKFALALSDGPQ